MATVHASAVVDPAAELGDDVTIGPFCVVGPNVRLGAGSTLHAHVVVEGDTEIGSGAQIHSFAAVGVPPQDLKFRGEQTRLVIGARVIVREHVTINPGTAGGGGLTQIGDDCVFLVGAHVAHDCRIGNHVLLVNNATLAGHCEINDHAILGGLSAVHQFVRIGAHAFIGGMSGVENDVIPYGSVIGNRAYLGGLNLVGLKRRGFPRDQIHALRAAYQAIFFGEVGTIRERAEAVGAKNPDQPLVADVVQFVLSESGRALCTPKENGKS